MKQIYSRSYYLVILFLLVFVLQTKAQYISYSYDFAGNRISRKVVTITNPSHVKSDSTTIEQSIKPVEDIIGDCVIKIYPNPTRGALAVDISGFEGNDALSIALYTPQGVLLVQKKITEGRTPVDMSVYPVGWYVLQILAGSKITEFKIIKQ